jgi:hypothetical protein
MQTMLRKRVLKLQEQVDALKKTNLEMAAVVGDILGKQKMHEPIIAIASAAVELLFKYKGLSRDEYIDLTTKFIDENSSHDRQRNFN